MSIELRKQTKTHGSTAEELVTFSSKNFVVSGVKLRRLIVYTDKINGFVT